MKIFYEATKGIRDELIERLATKTVPDLLRHMGHDVRIFTYDPKNPHIGSDFSDTATEIMQADVFIGEMSQPNQTQGFQLAYALNNTKPSLYLYHVSKKAQPGNSLMNNSSRLLKVKSYDEHSLSSVLEKFLKYATNQLYSTRTSFMSTRKIDSFIADRSSLLGISKAEIIRQALNRAADSLKEK